MNAPLRQEPQAMGPTETAFLREIASAFAEERNSMRVALAGYFEQFGETASAQIEVTNLNLHEVLVSGPGITADTASYLRGAGYSVVHTGDTLVAKAKMKSKPAPKDAGQRAVEGTKGGKKITELQYFNDEYSVRVARKLWTEIVEGQSYRFFPQFMKDLDDVIVRARRREGHEPDADPENEPKVAAAIEDYRGKPSKVAVAGADADPALIYNNMGEVVGTMADLVAK